MLPFTACDLNTKEQKYANKTNQLIDLIVKSNVENYAQAFSVAGSVRSFPEARIILFGESHTDEKGKLAIAVMLQNLVKPGDIVLFEGGQAGTVAHCASSNIVPIQAALHWRKIWKDYDPNEFFTKSLLPLKQLWNQTDYFLRAEKLAITRAKCFFWDNLDAHFEPSPTRYPIDQQGFIVIPDNDPLVKRNLSMAQTIEKYYAQGKHVFVIAGFLHLPVIEEIYRLQQNPNVDADTEAPLTALSTRDIHIALQGKPYLSLVLKSNLGEYLTVN